MQTAVTSARPRRRLGLTLAGALIFGVPAMEHAHDVVTPTWSLPRTVRGWHMFQAVGRGVCVVEPRRDGMVLDGHTLSRAHIDTLLAIQTNGALDPQTRQELCADRIELWWRCLDVDGRLASAPGAPACD